MYHGFSAGANQTENEKHQGVDFFEHHIKTIIKYCTPVKLYDILDESKRVRNPVVLTFDDGYRNNYTTAFPLLEKYGVPATIFVTSSQVGSVREYWWDDLERILTPHVSLPRYLRVTVLDRECEWQLETEEQKQSVRRALFGLLRPLETVSREKVLGELADWAGLEREGRPDYRPMTASQLTELAGTECIDIGAHTRTHPMLSALPADAQRAEILGGRQELESLTQCTVDTFAYPYGTAQDFTDETVQIVRETGFDLACTTVPGSVESGDDLFRLSRCVVYDWELDQFKQRLESYFVSRG